jgi:hypothetical protein
VIAIVIFYIRKQKLKLTKDIKELGNITKINLQKNIISLRQFIKDEECNLINYLIYLLYSK